MQTFLPFETFEESAAALDRQRLGKQRVETLQILKALDKYKNQNIKKVAWINHPATKMWNGHELSLIDYGIAICNEWISRGYNDTCLLKISSMKSLFENDTMLQRSMGGGDDAPWWLGVETLHDSHKAMLFSKDPQQYAQFEQSFKMTQEYWWPSDHAPDAMVI
jgi:hypothetical protein